MTGGAALLLALQHGDSAFPSGGFAFSNGIEGAAAIGIDLGAEPLTALVAALMTHRWATSDRVALARAHRAGEHIERLAIIDSELEATTLAEGLRLGSRRNGAALLAAHTRLATPGAQIFRDAVKAGSLRGHLAVAQGFLWRAVGMSETDAVSLGAYQTASGLIAAAVRLGRVGAIEAQSVLARVLAVAGPLALAPVADGQPLASFTPLIDVAAMRHAQSDLKLFAN
jgi:urease accessory protein